MLEDVMHSINFQDCLCSQALFSFFKEGYRYVMLADACFDDLSLFELQLGDQQVELKPRMLCLVDDRLHISLSETNRGTRLLPRRQHNVVSSSSCPKVALATSQMMQTQLASLFDTMHPDGMSRAMIRQFFMEFLQIDQQNKPKHTPVMSFVGDYTVVDIETTGLSPTDDAIIELAALRVRNHQVVASYSQLINPLRPIPPFIQNLTGITNEMVAEQPSLIEVAALFVGFIGNDLLVGHNIARFDASFLNYQVPYLWSSYQVVDTLLIARKLLRAQCPDMKLSTIARFFEIDQSGAHRALNDTLITQACYEKMAFYARQKNLSIESVRFQSCKASDFKAQDDCPKNASLEGKVFVITGSLGSLERKDAYQAIVDRRGIVKDSVVKNTDYLVVGDWDGPMTSKQRKALAMQRAGSKIEILSAKQFLCLLSIP
jgi:DNA polymerase-3 subunit epsilon